jgi:glycerol-3-phosphate acyltransferase PlsY
MGMATLFWMALGFLLGAIPFSVLVGWVALRTDIRRYGDGNPGAANVWRIGKWRVGLVALLLDYLKGALPVGLAHFGAGLSGWGLVGVALAPVVGHAFSPFLGGHGGKALAVTFGIWSGLTLWEGPVFLGMLLGLLVLMQGADAWSVVLGMLAFLGYLLLRRADALTLTVWGGNMLLLVWKHRLDLRHPIHLRPWVSHLFRRKL